MSFVTLAHTHSYTWLRRRAPALLSWSAVLLAYLLIPVPVWLIGGIALARQNKTVHALVFTLIAFLPIAISINNSKGIEGDWIWYSRQFLDYPTFGLLDIYGPTMIIANEVVEPVYFAASWFVAQLFPGELGALTSAIITAVYSLGTLTIFLATKVFKWRATQALLSQHILFSYGFTFTLNTHLVRQVLASAVLLTALLLLMLAHRRLAVLAMGLAVAIHTPAVIPALVLLVAYAMRHQERKIHWLLIIFSLFGALAGGVFSRTLGAVYGGKSEGFPAGFIVFLAALVVIGLAYMAGHHANRGARLFAVLALVNAMGISFSLGLLGEPIPAQRYFLYFSPFLGLGAGALVNALWVATKTQVERGVLTGLVVAGSVILTELRIVFGDLSFAESLFSHVINRELFEAVFSWFLA